MIEDINIPNKDFFNFSELTSICSVKSYVMRFWESEFFEISPSLNADGDKVYGRDDISAVLFIKRLLFEDKMSIERARAHMSKHFIKQINNYDTKPSTLDPCDEYMDDELSLEQLVIAKEKLNKVLQIAESIKSTHDWH